MEEGTSVETIDSILAGFNIAEHENDEPDGRECISVWVPPEYKEKYAQIQRRSKKKFGKLLREVVKAAIDKVQIDLDSAETM